MMMEKEAFENIAETRQNIDNHLFVLFHDDFYHFKDTSNNRIMPHLLYANTSNPLQYNPGF